VPGGRRGRKNGFEFADCAKKGRRNIVSYLFPEEREGGQIWGERKETKNFAWPVEFW